MNFYKLFQTMSENTVKQEIKKNKNFLDIEPLLQLLYQEIDIQGVNDKSKKALAYWVLFLFLDLLKKNKDVLGNIQHQAFYSQYLKSFIDGLNLQRYIPYLTSQADGDGNFSTILSSKFNNPNFNLSDLAILDHEHHDNLKKKQKNSQGAKGKTILNFPDGYHWVNLEKGYCDKESKSMGHCGNAGGRWGDTILSLRNSENIPHLTFILNNGVLGERKGKGNEKPAIKYHPYIIELLKLPIIKELGKGRYLPENDFQLNDLSEEQTKELLKIKPTLGGKYVKM
jgi:hypothetical protein